MAPSSNRKELRKFMGVIQICAKFISEESSPLRLSLSHEVSWHLDGNVLQAIENLKEILLWTAFNWTGLAASVIQSGKHVAYGSRGLTATEQKYSQSEKETLTIYCVRLTEIPSICLWKKNSYRN